MARRVGYRHEASLAPLILTGLCRGLARFVPVPLLQHPFANTIFKPLFPSFLPGDKLPEPYSAISRLGL